MIKGKNYMTDHSVTARITLNWIGYIVDQIRLLGIGRRVIPSTGNNPPVL
jgi:hypothetical protein